MNNSSIDPVIRLFKFNKLFFNPMSSHIDYFFKEINLCALSFSLEMNQVTVDCDIPPLLLFSRMSCYASDDLFLLYVQKNKNDPKKFAVYAIKINNIAANGRDICTQSVIRAELYEYKDIEMYAETIETYFSDYIAEQNTTCKVYEKSGEKNMRIMPGTIIPSIKNVYYTDRYTTIEWNDNVKTTVGCKEGEEFDKEIGLAMAIAKRYFGNLNNGHARSGFKHAVENAHDMSKKVTASKARKKAKRDKNEED